MAKKNKQKRNQHLKSHIIHSGTNKAIDSLSEINRHHSYSIGYNALLNGVQYMAQTWKTKRFRQGDLRKLEHTINARATFLTHVPSTRFMK